MIEVERAARRLCPLQSIGQVEPVPCAGKLCAWWDGLTGFCSIFTGADGIRYIGEQLCALNIILEGVEENAPASAANTDGDGVERIKTGVSTPTITENGEVVKMNGLPERIKVTISREDGGPVFSQDEAPRVLRLDEAAPVLVIVRDGGTLSTHGGDLRGALRFIEGLTLPF